MEPNRRAGREDSRGARPPSAAGSHRVRNGERGSGSTMDDELRSCGNWNPLPQTPQAGHRHWREVGNLSRLSRFKGLHFTVWPDLDQCDGEPARLSLSWGSRTDSRIAVDHLWIVFLTKTWDQISAFYRPPAFSIALIMSFRASSPERLVTVKCATDCRRRIFFFASTAISVICIATLWAFRSMILMSLSFCLDTIAPPWKMRSLCHWYAYFNPSCF